jgi:hypothetical protein
VLRSLAGSGQGAKPSTDPPLSCPSTDSNPRSPSHR